MFGYEGMQIEARGYPGIKKIRNGRIVFMMRVLLLMLWILM